MRKVITITINYNDDFHVPSDAEIDAKIGELIECLWVRENRYIVDDCTWDVNDEINEKLDRQGFE